jgi:hypothetical protein
MTLQQKPHLVAQNDERRTDPRVSQSSTAEITIAQPGEKVSFQAVLVNTSEGGLCIRHWHKELCKGQPVRVSSPAFPDASARVAWNWAVGPVIISGLQKIEDHSGLGALLHFASDRHAKSSDGNTPKRNRLRLRPYLFAGAAGVLLVAGWHFRTALWQLWSWS